MRGWLALLLFAPPVLGAQSLSPTCPVQGSATRLGSSSVVAAGQPAEAAKQSVRLELRPVESAHRIVDATVVVRALSLRHRVISIGDAAPDITRTFQLTAEPGRSAAFAAGLRLDQPAIVLWLDVTRLRYADGSAWQAADAAGCRVRPSDLVELAALP